MFRFASRVARQSAFTSRVLRAAPSSQAAPAAAAKKDGFLTLTFGTPNAAIYKASPVHMVTVSTIDGDMGVLAEHAPFLAELKPGVVSVFAQKEATEPTSRYFVPGGFLVVENDSSASVTASEAIPLEDFDVAAAKKSLDEATAEYAKAKDEAAIANARINLEVYTAIVAALEKK